MKLDIMYLKQLLNESEESVSRQVDQIKVLKEEIRRLYRNQQREDELQNLEYLKNILMKVGADPLVKIHFCSCCTSGLKRP